MTPEQRLRLLCDFYEAEAAGWEPPVADEDLLPPRHHFCEPRLLPEDVSDEFLAAVLSRLEFEELMEDERFRASIEQMRRGERAPDTEYVSAAPGPDWDPDDEWDANALNFDDDEGENEQQELT